MRVTIIFLALMSSTMANASIFGEETLALLKLVGGQAIELERLADVVGVAKDQRDLLIKLNDGIETGVRQIEAIQAIIERAKGLDPTAVSRISDLTRQIEDVKEIHARTEEVVALKLTLSDQAGAQGSVQSQTAYSMGQEMIAAGSDLAVESKTATPGRAAQITAASGAAQMLSQGVALQTLAHIAQLQAMQLELQKTQMERDQYALTARRAYFSGQLTQSKRGGGL